MKLVMKRVILAAAVAALSLVAGAKTIDVPLGGDIAAAVASAEAGDVVRLAAGEYTLSAEVKLEAGVTVKGAGRLLTTVKSDGATHRLFYLNHDDAVLSDLTAQDAVTSGGAAVSVNKGTFQDAIVRNCRNSGYSGGVWILNGTVRRCVLTGNTSTDGGGGIYVSGTCRIENVLSYGNTASWGGAIYTESGSHPTIVNCTFVGNKAITNGHDTYNYCGNNAKFVNTYRGISVSGGDLDQSPDSSVSGGFVAADLDVYRLLPGSALFEAGSTKAVPPETDADGSPMPAKPSIGAFQPLASPWIVLESAVASVGASVGVTVNYPDEAQGGTGTLVVIKPDGTRSEIAAAEGAQVSFTADQAGAYSLMLVVEKDGATVVRDLYNAIAAGVYDVYVDPNAANPVEPYSTPETAAATIADALPFVMSGGTVWIAEGELTQSSEVRLDRPVTVRGAGRLFTIVKSDGSNHRIFYLDDSDAVLCDLTVQGAKTGDGAVFVNNGTVQDVIVKNCTGGNGAGIYLENGTVRRCVLTGNSGNWGGGIYTHGNCRVESVLAYGNTASYGGGIYTENTSHATIVNCTFSENSSKSGGHDIYNYTGATRVYNTYLGKTAGQSYTVKSACFDSSSLAGFVAPNSGVFRLLSDSAMQTAGVAVPDADGGPAEADADGNPLPATPSVGAFQPIAATAPIVPSATTAGTGDPLAVTVNYPDEAKGGTGTLVLVNPDGTRTAVSASDGEVASVVPAQVGVHSVVLKVEKDGATVVRDLYHAFVTAIGNVFVDPGATGSAEPYSTPGTAAMTIEEALPFVMDGGTVWIAEGEYPMSKTLTINRSVTIRGAGADKTTVVSAANVRLFELSHPNAKIAGLTLRGTGESTQISGKGVYFQQGGVVEDCIFENFVSSGSGAAVTCMADGFGRVNRCVFRDNNSNGSYGAGVYVPGNGRIDIRNSLFYRNKALWGAGVMANKQGAGSLVNSTFYNNILSDGTVANGEFERESNDFGVTNCIFGTVCWWSGDTLNNTNNLGSTTPLADPGFRDAANHDYRLGPMATSAIDQGADEVVLPDEKDLLGRNRIGGEHVDLGCYEFYDDEFTAGFEIVGTATAAGDTVKLVPRLSGAADPTNSWRVVNLCGGDDIVGETRGNGEAAAFEVEIPGPGVYSFFYSVVDGENAASLAKEEALAVLAAGDVYVATSGSPVAPFDTPETATTNFVAAFRILPENATLRVLEGTYFVDRKLTVAGGRKVVGAGRDKTVLTPGLESTHGVFDMVSADSAITDLTITGASDAVKYADVKTGGGVLMSAGLLANVAMTNLVMANVNGSAIYATGGRISCVEMWGCTGSVADPGGVFLVGGMTAADNVLVCDCEGNWGSTVYVTGGSPTFTNCTFVYRSGRTSGPMYSSSSSVKFVNCNFDCRVYMPWDRIVTNCFYGCNFSGAVKEEHFAENGNVNVASADILYVDAANGNFHLNKKSPLVAAGLFDSSLRTMTDLDGRNRTTSRKVSIGCYQCAVGGTVIIVR